MSTGTLSESWDVSTYEEAPQRDGAQPINVGETERLISALAGGGLIAFGLSRRSLGGLGLAAIGGSLLYRGVTGHCMCYEALGVNRAGFDNPAVGVRAQHGCKYETSMLINRSPEELYAFWRNLENLPRIMEHLVSVTDLGDARSHWVAQGPLGKTVEWDAELINDRPGEMLAWRSIAGSELDTAGSVHFARAPLGHGAILKLSLKYEPPGGKAVASLTNLLGTGLEQRVEADLRRFKQVIEAGEVPSTAGQPHGSCRT
jgi:uncharacterized membrane protein